MSWKNNVLVGATVLGMAVGVNQVLQVKTPDDYRKHQQQQIEQQGSDAVEMENGRQLTPSEVRPVEPHIKFRIRP